VAQLLVSCTALAPKVVIVAGPTASGKSSLALQIARERNGIILNGDSLQVYRGIEILTAQPVSERHYVDGQPQPSLRAKRSNPFFLFLRWIAASGSRPPRNDDCGGIPHRLYGILDLNETCSAGKWLSLIIPEIEKAHNEGKLPIVVGGTGLYLKALMEGLYSMPPSHPDIRLKLQMRSQEDLYTELQKVDPKFASSIEPKDSQRTMRGLELFHSTGKAMSEWQSQKPPPSTFDFEKILLMPPKEELDGRIAARIDQMLEQGVLEEVKTALAQSPSPTAMKAIGLREFGAYLAGECSLEIAKELTLIHTRQYAKRQRTWFRHQFDKQRDI